MSAAPQDPAAYEAVCFRHPNRPTNVRCQNCGKPICGDCMRESPVGYRCPDCAPRSRAVMAGDLIVTKVLLGICLAVYVVQVVMGFSDGGGVNAITSTTSNRLFQDGALQAYAVGASHDWWRPITSGFLHAGLIHIALNSFFIYSFGQLLEPMLGKTKYVLLYFAAMLGGAVGALALSNFAAPTIGASGAGFGLLGAALVVARIRGDQAMASQLMILALINFAFTFSVSGISVGGHVGGFLAGGAVGYIYFGPFARQKQLVLGMTAGLIAVLFVASIVVANAKIPAVLPGFGG